MNAIRDMCEKSHGAGCGCANSHLPRVENLALTRREMLQRCGMGFGALALGGLLAESGAAAMSSNPLALKAPHFPARAKHVIHIFLNGGCSHVDTFDPKPALAKYAGQPMPGGNLATERPTGGLFGSPATSTLPQFEAAWLDVPSIVPVALP